MSIVWNDRSEWVTKEGIVLAIFYARMSVISRAKGHSAVAAAAYRSAARLRDERTGTVHNFQKKAGVIASDMLAPEHAPWALDLARVWCRAERAETRCNARVARELIVALPAELERSQHVALARQLGQDLVDTYSVAVLVAVHEPDRGGDARNAHVHLLMSTRVANADGFGAKVRCLDDQKEGPKEAEAIRARLALRINAALVEHGFTTRVDPRRLDVQAQEAAQRGDLVAVAALTRTPMRHVGRAATAAVRRGESSALVADNAQRALDNADICGSGHRRAVRMLGEIHREVARRMALGPPHRLSGGLRPSSSLLPTQLSASAVAAYLASLRQTERWVQELVRGGQRADALRARTERSVPTTQAPRAHVFSSSFKHVTAEDVSHGPRHQDPDARTLHAASPLEPSTRSTPAPPQPEATPPASAAMTPRQWAELRRQQRKMREGTTAFAPGQGTLVRVPAGFATLEDWRRARRDARAVSDPDPGGVAGSATGAKKRPRPP